jgi:hypothetical protein
LQGEEWESCESFESGEDGGSGGSGDFKYKEETLDPPCLRRLL